MLFVPHSLERWNLDLDIIEDLFFLWKRNTVSPTYIKGKSIAKGTDVMLYLAIKHLYVEVLHRLREV